MAVRRSSTILCASVFALALAAFKVADVSFIGSKAATRTPGVARFYESGKLDDVPLPAIEADRKTINKAIMVVMEKRIMGCQAEDCSVEELMELDQQLVSHEQRISNAMADVKAAHQEADVASLSKEDYGSALSWYDNFVHGMRAVLAELKAKSK